MKPDGTGAEIFARGVRNSVGTAWHPDSRELWFTDNFRDMLGDNVPPDELNRAPRGGLHFGYPYCHGGTIADPEFGASHPCGSYVAPARVLGPHVAALGLKFYTGTMFPQSYRKQIFIAEHGSWNRSTPIGYRISLVRLEGDKAVSYETFAEGWLQGRSAWGRPVDVLELPDGALLVSDDEANLIYRISYRGWGLGFQYWQRAPVVIAATFRRHHARLSDNSSWHGCCLLPVYVIPAYKDLDTWKQAMALVEQCYRVTASFPRAESYGITSQLRRAAVSIPSNIAEGERRGFTRAYVNHVSIALGSHGELETYIEVSSRLGYMPDVEKQRLLERCDSVGRLLNGLHRSLEARAL